MKGQQYRRQAPAWSAIFSALIGFGTLVATTASAEDMKFAVHEIGRPGGSNFGQTSAVDVDKDGDLDLVQAEGDVLDGRVAWFENVDGDGAKWTTHIIKPRGHNQDFHSMSVADFDNDGDIDIFAGGGPLTVGDHQWFVWENIDRGGSWKEHVVRTGLRTHESVCGDVDNDGDIDILTKPWRGDLHLYVENLTVGDEAP